MLRFRLPKLRLPSILKRPTEMVSVGIDRDAGYRRVQDLGPDYRFDE